MIGFGWKSWMVAATLVGAGAGLFTAARTAHRYRSDAVIRVVPQRVPDTYIRPDVTPPMSARLQSIREQILGRRTLEQVINKFNLYPEDRRHAPMDDVVDKLRKNVDIRLERKHSRTGPSPCDCG
jgi:succinoglycan biosynthesis transport protein ExoP